MNQKPPKAIVLISGGLDSALAAKMLKDQGIDVVGLHLASPFGCITDVQACADSIGIPLVVKEKGEAYLDLVKNPRFGYGKNMNPCIDCRVFMFQLADVVRQELGADFIATGEVLGQRPMSQQKHAMGVIDHHSPTEGLVLRPLSAQLMEPTLAEEKGWVKREKLLDISGRSRRRQLELAERWGIAHFGAPGGGCLLTESNFSNRLKDFFSHDGELGSEERLAQSALLRLGRHFRLADDQKIIVGRNQTENKEMEELWKSAKGSFFEPVGFTGPAAISLGPSSESFTETVGRIIVRYSNTGEAPLKIRKLTTDSDSTFTVADAISPDELEGMRI